MQIWTLCGMVVVVVCAVKAHIHYSQIINELNPTLPKEHRIGTVGEWPSQYHKAMSWHEHRFPASTRRRQLRMCVAVALVAFFLAVLPLFISHFSNT